MIYLDNAATSMPKAPNVANAMTEAVMTMGNASRGAHSAAMRASDTVYSVRSRAARMFNTESEDNVVFTMNATHAINIAVNDLAARCHKIAVSPYEHNAVMRALRLHNLEIVVVDAIPFDDDSLITGFSKAFFNGCDGAACICVSNVFGYKLPYEQISESCLAKGIPLLLDASQSAGIYSIDFKMLNAEYIAMPGHKGLYGPQGTGILLCKDRPVPLLAGGTGSNSISFDMPDFLPDRLEAGTLNLPGIAGLGKGLEYIDKTGISAIHSHEISLIYAAAEELNKINGIQIFWPTNKEFQSGVLSFKIDGIPSTVTGERLAERGIAVRSGLHCAPLAHRTVGTLDTGTVRISVSAMNSMSDICGLISAMRGI